MRLDRVVTPGRAEGVPHREVVPEFSIEPRANVSSSHQAESGPPGTSAYVGGDTGFVIDRSAASSVCFGSIAVIRRSASIHRPMARKAVCDECNSDHLLFIFIATEENCLTSRFATMLAVVAWYSLK